MKLRPKTLTSRLTVLLISILVVMAIIFGTTAYIVTEWIIEDIALFKLDALATAKHDALEDKLDDYIVMQHAYFTFAIVVLTIVGISVIVPIIRRFTRPISSLVSATREVAEGRLDVILPEVGDEEIIILTHSFNNMVRKLKETQEELSHTNEDLRKQSETLLRTQEDMETFIYSVSHDLKTPVVAVRGMVDLLREDLGDKLTGDPKIYVEHIDNSVLRIGQLIQDLLEMSRVGKVDTMPELINTGRIVKQVVASEKQVLGNGRNVEFVISPRLPDVYCNSKRFYQIISNLVNNAIKFTAGPSDVRIEIGCEKPKCLEDEKYDTFFVKDNGPGIPRSDQDKIFQMFCRLHGSEVPGTGMGLAFVKNILTTIGGSIWVDSNLGLESTFYFTIPVKGN